MKRVCVVLLVTITVVLGLGGSAHAGGSVWKFDRDNYQRGDHVFAWAPVAWEHNAELGDPADGPYEAFLVPAGAASTQWPQIPAGSVWVAEVQISLEPFDAGGLRFGPHHATIEFTVPDLPDGRYELRHCNRDCTRTLGDITFGWLTIGARPSAPPVIPEVVAPSTTTTSATTSTTTTTTVGETTAGFTASTIDADSSSSSRAVFFVGGALMVAIAAVATGSVVERRRRGA